MKRHLYNHTTVLRVVANIHVLSSAGKVTTVYVHTRLQGNVLELYLKPVLQNIMYVSQMDSLVE